jgi:predicted Zn-dependent protease
VDEIAGVMAHELGHIIARHIPERRAAELFARKIAEIFGWNAALGHDLISWRVRTSMLKPETLISPHASL